MAAYTAPDAPLVAGLMQELVDWLNERDGTHALVRAAMAHLHLVSIHPWADGNGRMSRSLHTLMIAREGVLSPEFSSIESWLGRPGTGQHMGVPPRAQRPGQPVPARPGRFRLDQIQPHRLPPTGADRPGPPHPLGPRLDLPRRLRRQPGPRRTHRHLWCGAA
ncbi:Fic family protein [Streptomyces sp900105755]|uniref:Fic family protein n=1 Tax=Streptomyces sp. 900105755 TaxID=3154389 RepID=UPI003316971C